MLIELLFIGWSTLGGRCMYVCMYVCSLANPARKGLGLALGVICQVLFYRVYKRAVFFRFCYDAQCFSDACREKVYHAKVLLDAHMFKVSKVALCVL
jgi:hypothetical protein